MGTWTDSFLTSFQFWVSCVAIAGTALGLVSAVLTLLARHETSIRLATKEKQRIERIEDAEKDLENTKKQLAEARREAEDARALAEKASKPKPFTERLTEVLEKVDAKILPAIKNGTFEFEGDLEQWKLAALREISAEPSAAAYIRLEVGAHNKLSGTAGLLTPVKFIILKDPSM